MKKIFECKQGYAEDALLFDIQGPSHPGNRLIANGLVVLASSFIYLSLYAVLSLVLIESAKALDLDLHTPNGKCISSNQLNSDLTSEVSFYSTLQINDSKQDIVPLLRKSISELPSEGGNIRIQIKDRAIWKGSLKISRPGVGLYFIRSAGMEKPEIHMVGTTLDLLAITGDRTTIFGGSWHVNGGVQRSVFFAKDVGVFVVLNASFINTPSGAEKYKIGETYTSGVRLRGINDSLIKCNSFENMFFDIYAKQVENLEVSHNVARSHRDAGLGEKRIGGGFIRLEVAPNSTTPNSKIDIHHNLVLGYEEGSYGGHLVNLQLGSQVGRVVQQTLHQGVRIAHNIFDVRVNGKARPSEISRTPDGSPEQIRNGASGDVIAIKAVDGFEVSQNAIYGSGEYGITVIASKGKADDIAYIYNNTIVNSDGAAIVIGREPIGKENIFPKSKNIEVTGNIVSGTSQMLSKQNAGIARLKKTKNWSKANAWGSLRVRGAENVRIYENVFTDIPTYGIWLRSTDKGIEIKNNKFEFRNERLESYSESSNYDYGETWATGVEVQLDNKKVVNGQSLLFAKTRRLYNNNMSINPDIAIKELGGISLCQDGCKE